MPQARIILLVSTAPAFIELVTRIFSSEASTTVVLEASSGAEAIEMARVQPLGLVILDLDFAGVVSVRDICLKLRALRPALPIVPIGTSLDSAPFLAELGCSPALSKALLVANPPQLPIHIQVVLEHEPVLKVPQETFKHLLEQAEAALREERRQDQLEVLVLCQNVLLRSGMVHSLTSLGIVVHSGTPGSGIAPLLFEAPPGAKLVIGSLSDVGALQTVARVSRLPLLLVALQQRELELTPYSSLAGVSIYLFDEGGDILEFLAALQTVVSGAAVLAVPTGVIARWVPPLDGLTAREWEVIVALLLSPDTATVAQATSLSVSSVETYAKRVRRKLGSRSLTDTLALVQAHVSAQLGVAPTALHGPARPARALR